MSTCVNSPGSGRNERELIFSLFEKRDYEGILALELVNLCLENRDGVSFSDIAEDILINCGSEIKQKHPIAYMRLAYVLFACGRFGSYAELLGEARQIAEASGEESLMGEWHIISAYEVFPDISAMTERYRRAEECLSGRSRVVSPCEPYMFGCPSMWYLFHTSIGGADAAVDKFEEMLAVYSRITGGHGSGAAALYRGEIACMRGQFEQAERLAGEARSLAEAMGQVTVAFGVVLLLGRIAVARSDEEALDGVMKYMDVIAEANDDMRGTAMNEYMVKEVRSLLISMLGRPQDAAVLKSAPALADRALIPTMMLMSYAPVSNLLIKHEYRRAIDVLELALLLESRTCSLAAKHYIYIGLGLCNAALGNIERAALNIDRALELSGPDRFFITFVRFKKELSPIFSLPHIKAKHGESIARINVLEANYAAKGMFNYKRLRGVMPDTLTKREEEIAHFAAEGLRNGEIAAKLYISEATVKGYMKTIFQKLDIDRRSKLADLVR